MKSNVRPWVKIQSAGWVKFQSARTAQGRQKGTKHDDKTRGLSIQQPATHDETPFYGGIDKFRGATDEFLGYAQSDDRQSQLG